MIGIYKITSPSGKIYIGQSRDIKARKHSYKNNRAKSQPRLYHSMVKYGFEAHSFEIIHFCEIEELDKLERMYIAQFESHGRNGLNCMMGGDFITHSNETRAKLSTSHKKKINEDPEYKKMITDRFRLHTRAVNGYKRDQSTTDKILATKKERGTLRMKQESLDKAAKVIRDKFKNNPEEMTAKMKAMRTESSGNFKKVRCTITGKEWPSCKSMCNEIGLNWRYTAKQLSGSRTNFTQYEYIK